jgi:hypothetical protein
MRQRLRIWLGVNANDYRLTCDRRVSSMFVHVFCSILSDLDDPSVRGGTHVLRWLHLIENSKGRSRFGGASLSFLTPSLGRLDQGQVARF